MFGRRRRRGLGLGGMTLIVGLLYYTGAGKWVWDRTLELEGQCYSVLAQMGTTSGNPICYGIGGAIRGTDDFFSTLGNRIANGVDSVRTMFSSRASMQSIVGDIHVTSALSELGSNSIDLKNRLMVGPQSLGLSGGSPLSEQIRGAIDSFNIGQRYLGGDGGSAYQALPWLQQGAQVPGYGILSQLSLGDIYRQGSTSVTANPQAAAGYYGQAYQSIDVLQGSGTPQAQQMLKALPASPQQIQRELLAVIGELKSKQK